MTLFLRVLAVAMAFVMCARISSDAAEVGEETALHIYTWDDFFDSSVITGFEHKYDCRVELSYFSSNESLHESLAAGGGYDIVTPSLYMASILWREGKILSIDHAKVPNLAHVDTAHTCYTEDPGSRYSVPYTRSLSGVGYHASEVNPADVGTRGIFSNSRYTGRLTMLADLRETIGAALKYLGYSLNTQSDDELREAGLVLETWKRNGVLFLEDQTKIGLEVVDAVASHSYNSDVILAMEDDADLDFFLPKEGVSLVADEFVILADTGNAGLAHAFINYMLDPETGKKTMEGIYYFVPIPAAVDMVADRLKNHPAFLAPREVLENSEVIRDLGPDNAKYRALWQKVTDPAK